MRASSTLKAGQPLFLLDAVAHSKVVDEMLTGKRLSRPRR
jgi:hypothetical protein